VNLCVTVGPEPGSSTSCRLLHTSSMPGSNLSCRLLHTSSMAGARTGSSSKIEDTVVRLKERAEQELAEQSQVEDLEKKINLVMEQADLAVKVSVEKKKKEEVAVKKSLGERVMAELKHYYSGFKLLFLDVKISSKIIWKTVHGKTLSRRENRQLVRTVSDLFRLVPFSVFIIVPFMELLLPVALKLFPGMLPSTFTSADDREVKLRRALKAKLEYARFLQKTLDSMGPTDSSGHHSKSASDFVKFYDKMKSGSAEPVTNKDILKFSKLFEDSITLDNMTRGQLVAICRLLEFTPIGTNAFLRFQIEMQLRKLKADDVIIAKEGVEQMTVAELQTACKERGMRAVGLTKEKLVTQLKQWIELSTNEKVPSSLLLLSRTLFLPETVAPAQAIEASISSLPETVATGAKAKIGEREGKIDNVTRLEIIQQEQEKIELEAKEQERLKEEKERKALEEKAKAERLAQAALEQAIEEQSVRMPPPAPPTAEGVVREATSILRKATVSQEGKLEDAGLGVAVTAHLADVMQESAPKKAVAKPANAEELTIDDLSALRDAIDALSQEKGQSFVGEHDVLADIKQELVDYEEDLGELKDVAESSGRKQMKQTKGAARLYKKVNRIMSRMDTVVAKLKSRETKLTENLDKIVEKSEVHEGHLVTVQDLLGAVQGLQKVPDSSRLERISEVIASMDEDSDGIVKVEHVQKVIEILGRDNVQLSAKQVKQIIDLIGKEEMLEVESKIEKILGKMPVFEEETVVIEAVKEQVVKSDGGLEKDLTEGAGDHVLEDVAVEMNEEKMEQHIAEIFSRPDARKEETGAPASAASMSLENSQILSRPPRDNSVKDVTATAAKDAVAVEEEVKQHQQEDQDDHQEEKIPQKNGSSKH